LIVIKESLINKEDVNKKKVRFNKLGLKGKFDKEKLGFLYAPIVQ
jgi:hypothetical protein